MGNFSCNTRRLFKCVVTLLAILVIAGARLIEPNSRTIASQKEKPTCELSESDKRLLDAVAMGDLKQVEALLAAGANPDGRVKVTIDSYDHIKLCPSPLIHALRQGKTDILKVLLKASYSRDKDGNYSHALDTDRYVIEMLIASGGDINTIARAGATTLIIAAGAGRIDLVRFLLENGANVNSRSNIEETALVAAANRLGDSNIGFHDVNIMGMDKDNVAELLVTSGGDVNASNNMGDTPLILAATYGRVDLVRFLLKNGAKVNHRNKSGDTALTAAASLRGYYFASDTDKDKVVEALVAAGGDINTRDDNDDTPLIIASREGKVGLVRILLESGADMNLRNKSGQTALMAAALPSGSPGVNENKAKAIKLFGLAKADINAKDNEGNTVLISAARYGWYINTANTIIKALVSSGANVNASNNNGDTALIGVIKTRDGDFVYSDDYNQFNPIVNTIEILATAGEDMNAENRDGDTALKVAIASSRADRSLMGILNALTAR